jgi:hypothetical protein
VRVVHVTNSLLVALGVAFVAFMLHPAPHTNREILLFTLLSLAIGCGAGAYWYIKRAPQKPAHRPAYCTRCGYNLTGNVSGRCAECGTVVPPDR